MKIISRKKLYLLICLIFLLVNLFVFGEGLFVIDANAEQAESLEVKNEKFVYSRDNRRDPLITLIDKKGIIKDDIPNQEEDMTELLKIIKVDGIIWDEEMPLAMINNKIIKIGDVVNELTIKAITSESVIFKYFDLTHTITIIEKKDF